MKSGIVVLFGLASFLAAVLLFSAQPMIGKMVLACPRWHARGLEHMSDVTFK